MKKLLFVSAILIACITKNSAQDLCNCPSQSKVGKGTIYFAWGYNRDWFSKTDLHLKNTSEKENYDFTVYDAAARDRPDFHHILSAEISIPQYNYRLGYFFNNRRDLGLEINFDHVKYVVRDWQTLHVKGTIHGQVIDQDTLIGPDDFLHFEHTNGANFLMLNAMKRQRLLVSKNKKHWLSGVAKVGAGIVIPKTFVKLFGQQMDNRFHIAGYCAGVETGLRYDAFKHFFLEYTAKGTFANYTNVLVIGSGRAHHHFWTLENILLVGFQIPI